MSRERAVLHGRSFVHVAPSGRATGLHALPLHKLVVPIDGAVLSCVYEGRPFETRAPLLVGANVLQAMSSSGPTVAVFAPAITMSGRSALAHSPLRPLEGRECDRWERLALALLERTTPDAAAEAMTELTDTLLVARRLDERVHAALSTLESWEADGRPSIEGLAATVDLSASRFSHLFAASTGISVRSWLSFQRMFRAVQTLARNRNLASVARTSGYADQSHLTRDLRRQLGRTPGTVASAIIQDVNGNPR